MATVNKNFRVKNGLVVEGTTATVNGNNILTDANTTDDITEGITNQYFTDEKAVDAVATAISNGSHTNITITYDDVNDSISFTGSSSITDTDDVPEGATNLYFTNQRALDATASAYDAAGSASTAESNANSYTDSTIAGLDSNDITEGDTNLYYTDTRARGALSGGTGITYTSGTGEIAVDTSVIASKSYVDGAVSGLNWKAAVNLFADSNVSLTGTTNTLQIDGHSALDSSDDGLYRILLTAQSTDSQNGIYLYTDDGANYELVRTDDADTYEELVGAAVFVMEGTSYGSTSWVQANHYLSDFTNQEWDQFSGQGTYTAGNGLQLVGNEFSINADTDDVTEGATNLYFTDARAQSAVDDTARSFTSVDINSIAKHVAAEADLTTTSQTAVYSFAKADYRSAKFLVKSGYGSHTEVSEVLITLDTSDNVAIMEYGEVTTNGNLVTLSAGINGSNVELLATAGTATTYVKVVGTLIA